MIISKIIAVLPFGLGVYFFIHMLTILLAIGNMDKEDRIRFSYILLMDLLFGCLFIIGGIQLWQI